MTKWHFEDKKAAFLRETEAKKPLNLMLRRITSVDELEPGLRYQENRPSYAVPSRGKGLSLMTLIELYIPSDDTLCQLHAQGKRNESNR